MQSEIANRDYQQQAEGLKMLLQSRLGLAQQQQQHDTGMGMLGMQGVLMLYKVRIGQKHLIG